MSRSNLLDREHANGQSSCAFNGRTGDDPETIRNAFKEIMDDEAQHVSSRPPCSALA
jgi:hypothetical protein